MHLIGSCACRVSPGWPTPNPCPHLNRGLWTQGQRSGMGVQEHANGERFCGSWEADVQEGYGQQRSKSGCMYEGMWHKGRKHGWGVSTRACGAMRAGTLPVPARGGGSFEFLVSAGRWLHGRADQATL